jgi:SagB-type dehydrogenase family enzyme
LEIQLPKPHLTGTINLEECILKRESVRSFLDKDLEMEKISQLLWAGQGKKGYKRTVPSAGATYPLFLFVVLKGKGIYLYKLQKNALETIIEGDFSKELAEAAWNQSFIDTAPLNIVICADYSRTCNRYGDRGVRYVFMEVGHCAQNLHLEAVALGLGSVPIGAFDDKKVKKIVKLPENIDPLYIVPIGYLGK